METLVYTGLKLVIVGAAIALLPTLTLLALGKHDAPWFGKVALPPAIVGIVIMLVSLGILIYAH